MQWLIVRLFMRLLLHCRMMMARAMLWDDQLQRSATEKHLWHSLSD
jgi:hypothetical protein